LENPGGKKLIRLSEKDQGGIREFGHGPEKKQTKNLGG